MAHTFTFTRDDMKWTIGILAGTVTGIAGGMHFFPWVSSGWQHGLEFAGFALAILAAQLRSSPLPGDPAKDPKQLSGAPSVTPP